MVSDAARSLGARLLDVPPDQLAGDPEYADLTNGAIWYYGERYLRVKGRSFTWKYDRKVSPDCHLQGPQPVNVTAPIGELEIAYQSYERGILRRRFEHWA